MIGHSNNSKTGLSSHARPRNGNPLQPKKHSRILIIDDTRAIHDDFRKILGTSSAEQSALEKAEASLFGSAPLQNAGSKFVLDSAYQGSEGLELAQQAFDAGERYAMAFVDVRMPPGMDGIETTAKLWEIDPDLQIVICTAYSDYSWDEMIDRIGNSDRLVILKKPFDTVEVLQLANALTEKWRLLQQTRQTLNDLEKQVTERTAHLETANKTLKEEVAQRKRREHLLTLQQGVTQVLADSMATTEEVATKILQIICQGMDWQAGELWAADRNGGVLRPTALWYQHEQDFSEFKTLSQQTVFPRGTGLPGQVWQTGEPAWISNVTENKNFLRSEVAAKCGLRASFAFPIRLQGETLGVIGFLSGEIRQPETDILQLFATLGSLIGQSLERKKLEEQLRHSQKMDAIGYLAGGVAHDFNNILTVILGYSQILGMREDLDPATADALRQITHASQRATSLTSQLLTFSRKQVMKMTELNLNKVTANLAKMLHRIIGEDISLQFDYCQEPTMIHADEDSIGQVLMNLTVNARDAMPRGGKLEIHTHVVEVTTADLHRHADARPGEFICLTVSDTGCGVPPEILSHIFEPFFTTKKAGEGTGLGLATVHGIVAQHQGWIEVISRANVGTIFKIFLPRLKSVQAPPAHPVEMKMTGGSETILLVEDESAVRSLASRILTRQGYRVIEASSGVEALSVWKEHEKEINLLLTDIVMPDGVTGRELAHQLRLERPGLNVVFTSGYDPDKSGLEAELGDEISFLPKPYSPQKLLNAVRESLDFKTATSL